MHGSGGMGGNVDYSSQLTASGIATFAINYFTGRGIENTNADQGKLPPLAEIIDIYKALALLGKHPRIDPNRIAVMGFSRGAQAALYSSLLRFQKMYVVPPTTLVSLLMSRSTRPVTPAISKTRRSAKSRYAYSTGQRMIMSLSHHAAVMLSDCGKAARTSHSRNTRMRTRVFDNPCLRRRRPPILRGKRHDAAHS